MGWETKIVIIVAVILAIVLGRPVAIYYQPRRDLGTKKAEMLMQKRPRYNENNTRRR